MVRVSLVLFFILGSFFVAAQGDIGVVLELQDSSGPLVFLEEPMNNSLHTGATIALYYNASDLQAVDNCSLFVSGTLNTTDHNATNDIQLNFTLINLSLGYYNWSVACSDTTGQVGSSGNRTFGIVRYSEFNGSSTNLSAVDISNINTFFVATASGSINYTESVNLLGILDFDELINISNGSVFVNSTGGAQLNASAIITLHNLSFINPRPVRDGVFCSDICTEISYESGTFRYSVTHFTVYSAEETPITAQVQEAVSGGGRKRVVVEPEGNVSVDTPIIIVRLTPNSSQKQELIISNTGDASVDVTVDVHRLRAFLGDDYLFPFTLDSGQAISFPLTLSGNGVAPGVYREFMWIRHDDQFVRVLVIVEVLPVEPLLFFDVGSFVSETTAEVNVRGTINLPSNILFSYELRTIENELVRSEQELKHVSSAFSFTKPFTVEGGEQYLLLINASVGDEYVSRFVYIDTPLSSEVASPAETIAAAVKKPIVVLVIVAVIAVGILLYWRKSNAS